MESDHVVFLGWALATVAPMVGALAALITISDQLDEDVATFTVDGSAAVPARCRISFAEVT